MRKPAVVMGFLLLSAISADHAAIADDATPVKRADEGVRVRALTDDRSNVATAQKPATYLVQNESEGAEALELTARPLAGEASSAYLVQVFVEGGAQPNGDAPKLLGTFSFFPARVGQAQTFVLPKPVLRDTSSAKGLTLSIKLVSANASRTLEGAAVEIMDARLVK